MTMETIPLGSYKIPREGGEDDEDDIEFTVESPITVTESGVAEFKLTVNWPNDLDNVKVTILPPTAGSASNASISPTQTNQHIDATGTRAIFTHDAATTSSTISYKIDVTANSSGTFSVSFKLEADELEDPVTRSVEVVFQS